MIDPRQDEIDRLARELQFEAEEKKRSPKQKKTNVAAVRGRRRRGGEAFACGNPPAVRGDG